MRSTVADQRTLLRDRIAATPGVDLKSLSRALGRNDAYLQQYVGRKQRPKILPLEIVGRLAQLLNCTSADLGVVAWRSYLDLMTFPLTHPVPECGAEFSVVLRGLIDRTAVTCPSCGLSVDLTWAKGAIDKLVRIAAELDGTAR